MLRQILRLYPCTRFRMVVADVSDRHLFEIVASSII